MPHSGFRLPALQCSIAALLVAAAFTRLPAADAQKEEPSLVPPELFALPDDLEVTVWATSPMLYNPTNIDFDKDGRLWVAEGVDYRGKSNRRPAGDRIVVL